MNGVRKKWLCGETNDFSTTTVKTWIERIPELCRDFEPWNILILGKLGLLFKALPSKRLMKKGKKTKGGKKCKQCMTAMFIVVCDSSFLFKSTVIWRLNGPRCCKSLNNLLRPIYEHYFSNKKPSINSDIMESILSRHEVVLFWDNYTVHPGKLEKHQTFFSTQKRNMATTTTWCLYHQEI